MAQVVHETDDEDLDDPIKLFDLEQDRVHFGSVMIQNEDTNTTEHHEIEHNSYNSDDETSESTVTCLKDKCIPINVKLVDCKKFPWYYKKYTEQILDLTSVCDLISESENEIDVEYMSDSNDCIIINNIPKQPVLNNEEPPNNSVKTTFQVTQRSSMEKRQQTIKNKENFELRLALSQQNKEKIDFKRNTGLVGMVVSQKIVDNSSHKSVSCRTINKNKKKKTTIKRNKTCGSFIRAADKILNAVGTDLIPIPEVNTKSSATANITPAITENQEDKDTNYKVPVKFSLGKIPKNLLSRILTSKPIENSNNEKMKKSTKNNSKYTSSLNITTTSTSEVVKSSSNHVKNVMKTNIYKNIQTKAIERMIMGQEDSDSKIEDNTAVINNNEQDRNNQSSHKIVAEKIEPKSPILPCSSLARKRDVSELSKNKKTNKTITFCHKSSENKNLSDTNYTKKCLQNRPTDKEAPRKNVDKSDEIGSINEATKAKDNEPNSQSTRSNYPLHIVSIKTIATPDKSSSNTSLTNTDKNVPPTSNVTPTSLIKPMPTVSEASKMKQFMNTFRQNSGPYLVPPNTGYSRPANNSETFNSPYASAIVLRPSRPPTTYQIPVRYTHPSPSAPSDFNFHVPLPPLSPPFRNRNIEQRFIPRSANCAVPNFRFPAPCAPSSYEQYPIPYSTTQPVPRHNFGHPTIIPGKVQQETNDPRRLSDAQRQMAQKMFPAKFGILPKIRSIFIPNVQQTNNVTADQFVAITNNKNTAVNKRPMDSSSSSSLIDCKDQVDPNKRYKKSTKDDVDVIKEKTQMLEVLNSPINKLKRGTREIEELAENTFKRPRNAETVQAVPDRHQKLKGYSPPILPIPSFENILERITGDSHKKNVYRDSITSNKKASMPDKIVHSKSHAKRIISVEEYNNRLRNMYKRESLNKNFNRDIHDKDKKQQNVQDKVRGNVDRFSTESDLGYDSDSTVII